MDSPVGSNKVRDNVSPEEWAARVDLAAIYRLTEFNGWGDGIFNHSSLRVPGEDRMFLIKRHDMLYPEVTASNLVKVCMDEDLDEKAGVNRPGFVLHGSVLRARDDINCAIHIHTPQGIALSALPSGLRMLSQHALRLYGQIAYHDFEGIAEDAEEGERIGQELGEKSVMILHNHGFLTTGATARQAWNRMRYLHSAAETQLIIESTGQKVPEVAREVCEATAAQQARHDKTRALGDWPANLRLLDRIDTSYRD